MGSLRVAVVGATGYGGAELCRLILGHPRLELAVVTSERRAGSPLRSECPWLDTELVLTSFNPEELKVDAVFLGQEAGFAMRHAAALAPQMKVVDLSADFRFPDPAVYADVYGREHAWPEHGAVYGLPEMVGPARIREASVVANPGCHSTAALLGLMPLERSGLIGGVPVVDSLTGVSGAGRSRLEADYLFSEVQDATRPYGALLHRHVREVEQFLGRVIRFTPHLVPMARGISSMAHVPLQRMIGSEDIRGLFESVYADSPFIRIVETPASTKQVRGTNRAEMWVDVDPRTEMALVHTVIDNLGKGAAGQALQNLNLMLGLEESLGLLGQGWWP